MTVLILDTVPGETRAVLTDRTGRSAQDLFIERETAGPQAGDILWARVQRVVPGMDAAFVDVGDDQPALLHSEDVPRPDGMRLSEHLPRGTDLLVQIRRAAGARKGARVTAVWTVAGRWVVVRTGVPGLSVSRKIQNDEERARLRTALEGIATDRSVHIVARTQAAGRDQAELQAEANGLIRALPFDASPAAPGTRVYRDQPLVERVGRDFGPLTRIAACRPIDMQTIRAELDAQPTTEHPELNVVAPGDRLAHLFRNTLADARRRALRLPQGIELVFDEGEAMTTIDVNSANFSGHAAPGETALAVNTAACRAIARHIRLRNLSGLIVVDFIDMSGRDARTRLYEALRSAFREDPARVRIEGPDRFGLVEIARKWLRPSFRDLSDVPCHHCEGSRFEVAVPTVGFEALRWLQCHGLDTRPALEMTEALHGWWRGAGAKHVEAVLAARGTPVEIVVGTGLPPGRMWRPRTADLSDAAGAP